MTDDAEDMVAFRLPARDRAAIQRLIDEGEFRNRSDFLRYAVKSMLREHENPPTARVELELEDYQLPAQDAVAPKGARSPRGRQTR